MSSASEGGLVEARWSPSRHFCREVRHRLRICSSCDRIPLGFQDFWRPPGRKWRVVTGFSEGYSYKRTKSWVLVRELPLPSCLACVLKGKILAWPKGLFRFYGKTPNIGQASVFCPITTTAAIEWEHLENWYADFRCILFFGCQYVWIWDNSPRLKSLGYYLMRKQITCPQF